MKSEALTRGKAKIGVRFDAFVHVHHLDGAHDANVVPRECRRDIDLAWAWAKNYAWDQASREIM